jgi:hypothetical protein
MGGDLIMSLTYGISIQPSGDPFIAAAEKGMGVFVAALSPRAFLVDMFPWLKWVPEWVPGAGFKRKAREWRKCADAMLNDPYEVTKQDVVSNQ